MKNPNLYDYPNLSAFFYRELKDGVRPIAEAPLVSPSDGKVLHYGVVQGQDIEQIKGVTYRLDALLGSDDKSTTPIENAILGHEGELVDEEEFANVNGIEYSLDDMLAKGHSVKTDSSVGPDGLARTEKNAPKDERALVKLADVTPDITEHKVKPGNALYFCVVYLAPGDYHRFHSPTNWVVQTRRHFAGKMEI
jgi:phosphatidylserine decarboxylase